MFRRPIILPTHLTQTPPVSSLGGARRAKSTVENVKDMAHKVNLTTGKVLASQLDKVEELTDSFKSSDAPTEPLEAEAEAATTQTGKAEETIAGDGETMQQGMRSAVEQTTGKKVDPKGQDPIDNKSGDVGVA